MSQCLVIVVHDELLSLDLSLIVYGKRQSFNSAIFPCFWLTLVAANGYEDHLVKRLRAALSKFHR